MEDRRLTEKLTRLPYSRVMEVVDDLMGTDVVRMSFNAESNEPILGLTERVGVAPMAQQQQQ